MDKKSSGHGSLVARPLSAALFAMAIAAPLAAQAQATSLQDCFTQYCFSAGGQCTDPNSAFLPGICILVPGVGPELPADCQLWAFYGEYCAAVADDAIRQAGPAGADLDQCLVDHCLADGGQCTLPDGERVVPGGCVLLDEEVDGKTYTVTAACSQFVNQGRDCAAIEALAPAASEKSESDGCSTRPGPAGAWPWALGLLALGLVRRRRHGA